jgi:4-hydroxybenzoate polyprenyltransferase
MYNLIKLLRIKDWFYVSGIAFLGYFYKIKYFNFNEFLYLLTISIFYVSSGYILNNYFDIQIEKPVYKGKVKYLFFIAIIIIILNLFISFLKSYSVFVLMLSGTVISFLYSSFFTRFKDKPFWNIILNSTGFVVLFCSGYIFNKAYSNEILFLSVYIWFGIVPSQIIHLTADRKKENNWRFSIDTSLELYYLFDIIWVLCAFFIFCFVLHIPSIFLLTLLFCIVKFFIIKKTNYDCLNIDKFISIRNRYKIAHVIFGILLAFIFLVS